MASLRGEHNAMRRVNKLKRKTLAALTAVPVAATLGAGAANADPWQDDLFVKPLQY
jgi:hypothetical protein